MWEVYKSPSFIAYLIHIRESLKERIVSFFLPHYPLRNIYEKKIMNQSEEFMNPEWHNIADVAVQRICNNSITILTLCVKIISGEHVRILTGVECVNGFGYNAVTASNRLYL